jgi:hypothetical protein
MQYSSPMTAAATRAPNARAELRDRIAAVVVAFDAPETFETRAERTRRARELASAIVEIVLVGDR